VVRQAVPGFLEERPDVELVVLGIPSALPPPQDRLVTEAVGEFDGSTASAGAVSLAAIRRGVELALAEAVAGLVTGPVSKPALQAGGSRFPGQTELLGDLAGAERVGMLMDAERTRLEAPLRILLATTHVPLREVPSLLTSGLLEEQVLLLRDELRDRWRIERPRIALCALNPHASDEGLFGDEEERIFLPAIHRLRELGVELEGPSPADTVFLRALEGHADAVVAPYHDVGMAVFKTLAFGQGVNVTLGLPFVRTSPDHGTAFDLTGTGRAHATSFLEALRLAARLAGARTFDTSPDTRIPS
jgi:4-hydroxythreonine-4-phosphate dehydrogenase